ncbi:MAG: substrate-binding domain-containing protein [Bacillota bacterium]
MIHKTVTAVDIAKKLNISRITVDRVLNNRGGVSEKTAQRVLETVKELGYTPNRAAKHLAKKTQCCIGVSYTLPKWFKGQIDLGIEKAFSELKDFGAKVIVRDAPHTVEGQIAQIKEMLPEIDALAVEPWIPALFSGFIDELVDGGLPVATFNVDVPSSKRLFYIGCNYIEAGRLCGEIIRKMVTGAGKVAMITAKESLTHLEQRIIGFREVLSGSADLKIIGPFKINEADREGSVNQIKEIIAENPDLAAIYHLCSSVDLSGIALKESGKSGLVKLIGHDVNDEYYKLILEDVIQAVVCQEPYYQGYFPIKILFNYVAEGRWPERTEVTTRLEVVMRENLKYYYNYQPIS